MRRSRARAVAAVSAAALIAWTPAAGAPRPPGLKPAPDSVEAGLWDLSDKAEREARNSAELNTDAALNTYVRDIICKVAAEYCGEVRLYVLDRPYFNAAMSPNGYAEVWSGLLLRCADESELAFVLSHEVVHYAENHTVERYASAKQNGNVALVLTMAVPVVGLIYLVSTAFQFSREQEVEADLAGVRRQAAAGYRPAAGAEIWRSLMDETAASDFEKVRKEETRLGIFNSHPLSRIRAAAIEEEAAKLPPTQPSAAAANRHRAAIRPFLGAWLKDDLRRRDFGQTLHIVDRLARSGEDLGVLNFYRGEAFRQRGQEGDLTLARDAYLAAVAHPDAPDAAWRELGEARRRTGDPAGARAALETYLSRAPEAEDAWMVRETLDSLSKGD
ncbi:MAG: M48 family metalloprotease [Pseudomonadota bacterium]